MADRRRRRRNSSNTESEYSEGEETSKAKVGTTVISECESEFTHGEETSEFDDSTTEGPDEDDEDETETEDDEDDDDETTEDFDDDDDDVIIEDDGWIDEERQSGDGEEEPDKLEELDDDEDKKNPAYIPRRGAFYEHDTRIGEDTKEEVKEQPKPKQTLWQDHGKWTHDRFHGDQQAPKSREEIIAIYGYDIRSYEKPPEGNFRGKNRRRGPDSRKQLRDFMWPQDGSGDYYGEDNRSSNQFYGRAGWRGRGGGSRGQRYNNNRDYNNRAYTDYKNSQNRDRDFRQDQSQHSKPSVTEYNRRNNDNANDPNSRATRPDKDYPSYGRDSRGKSMTPDREHSQPIQRAVQLQKKPIPPDVVPTSHVVESYIAESAVEAIDPNSIEPATSQTVRSKFRRGHDHENKMASKDAGNIRQRPREARKPPYKDEYYRDTQQEGSRDNNKEGYGDRKSYSKDRRNKTGRTHRQDCYTELPDKVKDTASQPVAEGEGRGSKVSSQAKQNTVTMSNTKTTTSDSAMMSIYPPVTSNMTTTTPSTDEKKNLTPQQKAMDLGGQNRPKRYSSQRQRPQPETGNYTGDNPPEATATQSSPVPAPAVSLATAPVQNPRHVTPPVPGHGFFPRPVFNQQQQQPVFRNPLPSTTTQAPAPHSISFPPAPVIPAPIPSVPFSIPASTNVQSPPRIPLQPSASAATVTMTQAVPAPGNQPIIQGAYVAAPVVNYGPPSHQGPPSHYQMATPMPIQFPTAPIPKAFPPAAPIAQNQGPDPILVRGGTTYFSAEAQPFRSGTTYFSPEAQQPSPSRTPVSRRPKAAIPIINPQEVHLSQDAEDYYDDEDYEYGPEDGEQFFSQGGEYVQQGEPPEGFIPQGEPPEGFIPQDGEYPAQADEGFYSNKQPSDTDLTKDVRTSSLSAMAQEFQQSCSVQSQDAAAGADSETSKESGTAANTLESNIHQQQVECGDISESNPDSQSDQLVTQSSDCQYDLDNTTEGQGQEINKDSVDDSVPSGDANVTALSSSSLTHPNNHSETTQSETETQDSSSTLSDSGNPASQTAGTGDNSCEENLPNQSMEKIVTEIKVVYKEAQED